MKSLKSYINENYITESTDKHYVDALLIADDKLLILRRANYMKKFGGHWGLVGGSIDNKDKNSKEAIIREIKEETGIELTFNEQHKMKMVEKRKHEDNSDTEYWMVNLESIPDIKISREHSKYEWADEHTLSSKNYKFIPYVFQVIQKYIS